MRRAARVELSPAEHRQLEAWARLGPPRGRLGLRARIVLEAARGATNSQIAARLGVHLETVARWRSRFVLNGLEGVSREAPRAGSSGRVSRATVRRIVRATLARGPSAGGRWTTRSLARSLRVNHMLVHRVWTSHGLGNRPTPGGPAAVPPRVDLAGAFVTPSARALVFTVDDRPGPPSAPRAVPELVPNPTSSAEFSGPGALSREVVRAVGAIEATGAIRGPRSESSLLVFLRGAERNVRRSLRLEVVFDRSVSRLGRRVARWLASHGRFHVFTPARDQRWSEAVDAWLRRWDPGGLDRESLGSAPLFAQEFPWSRPMGRETAAPYRFSWGPAIAPPLPAPRSVGGPERLPRRQDRATGGSAPHGRPAPEGPSRRE